jgi:hypothetical protein
MRGTDKLLQGVKDLGKQLKSKKTALLGAVKNGSSALAHKTTGLKTSLRKLAKGSRRRSV